MLRAIKKVFHFLEAFLAAGYYHFPARGLRVIGITGTCGKTTTAHLLYEILKAANFPVSLISTIGAIINGKNYETGFHVTTPSPFSLQRFLSLAEKGGSKIVVLEVTSHALDQFRVWGIPFEAVLITNVSHEHLDYHQTFANYRAIKATILKGAKYVFLNRDDPSFDFFSQRVEEKSKLFTFGIEKKSDFNFFRKLPTNFSLPGKFNQYNMLAAWAVAAIFDIDEKIVRKVFADFPGLPGRMEEVEVNKPFKVIIDFAHKPEALKEALLVARKFTKKKLIVVFGCAGLRDRLKRPMMGELAIKFADYTILTAEDPRIEDVRKINQEIASGCRRAGGKEADKRDKKLKFLCSGKKYFWSIPDRQEAINFAIRNLAQKGDVVLLCGKGHEKSMCYGKTEYPWDEKEAVRKALYVKVKTS